jgi:hypothetical protein
MHLAMAGARHRRRGHQGDPGGRPRSRQPQPSALADHHPQLAQRLDGAQGIHNRVRGARPEAKPRLSNSEQRSTVSRWIIGGSSISSSGNRGPRFARHLTLMLVTRGVNR